MDAFSLLIVFIVCSLIGAMIGAGRDRTALGFFCGLLIGPIGLIVIALVPKRPSLEERMLSAPSAPPAPAPSPADATAALLDLKKLLDAGAITQAEFDAKKPILLARIGAPATSSPRSYKWDSSSVRYESGDSGSGASWVIALFVVGAFGALWWFFVR